MPEEKTGPAAPNRQPMLATIVSISLSYCHTYMAAKSSRLKLADVLKRTGCGQKCAPARRKGQHCGSDKMNPPPRPLSAVARLPCADCRALDVRPSASGGAFQYRSSRCIPPRGFAP